MHIFKLTLVGILLVSAVKSQQFCGFNGPTDRDTLQGASFIENFGTGECLTLEKQSINYRVAVNLDSCQWNTQRPSSSQLFAVKNSGGGSLVQPTQTNAANYCFAITDGKLTATLCNPKSDEQNWLIRRNLVPGGGLVNEYQIIQNSSGRCLKVNSGFGTNNVVLVECDQNDKLQQWRLCTSNGSAGASAGASPGFSGPG